MPSLNRTIPDGAYINLGCGPNARPDFVNIDFQWLPGVDICRDLTKGVPAAGGSAAGIFSEHCIEHVPLDQARALLADCHRVMRSGAIMRIVVPDLEIHCRTYLDSLANPDIAMPNERYAGYGGINRPVAVLNMLFYGSAHRFIYDSRAMAEVLRDAGFVDIVKCAFLTGGDPRLLVDDPKRRSESLYVEARKP